MIDDGVLQYIGDEGAESKATGRRDYYQEKTELNVKFNSETMKATVTNHVGQEFPVIVPGSGWISKESFPWGVYLFDFWLEQNNPPELQPLKEKYGPIIEKERKEIEAARQHQKEILKKGLKDAYSSLKVGGTLIIPIDGTLNGVDVPGALGVSEDRVVRNALSTLLQDPSLLTESPILPQNARGMGTGWGDYYTVIKH